MTETFTPCGFIDDGYTEDFIIAEVPGVHIALNGKYRSMTSREVNNFIAALDASKYVVKKDPVTKKDVTVEDQIDTKSMEAIAGHIAEWSLTDRNGASVAINPTNLGRINPPALLGKLIDIVTGIGKTTPASEVRNIAARTDLGIDKKLEMIREILEAAEAKANGSDLKN